MKSKQSLKLKDIGLEFGISERATRYDLDAIDNFLLKHNFSALTRKTNVGVSYNVENVDCKKLYACILDEREGTIYDTPVSRLVGILVFLIVSKKQVYIDGEAERLLVSRSTVFKDFEKLRMLFGKESETLASSVAGYNLQGSEKVIRLECARVILSIIESRDIVEIINYASNEEGLLFSNKLYKMFEGVPQRKLRKSLSLIMDSFGGHVEDHTFAFCTLALCIGYRRHELEFFPKNEESVAENSFAIAREMFGEESGEETFVSHLLARVFELEDGGNNRSSLPDVQLFAYNLIKKVSNVDSEVDISGGLLGVVSEEIIELIFDDQYGKGNIAIDMSQNIAVQSVIKEELQILEGVIGREIVEADIGRFFRIFQSGYSQVAKNGGRKNVIVLCPFDKIYSKLVTTKIQSMFDVNVFECVGFKALDRDIEDRKADLIVSTLPLAKVGVDSVKIGTNLSEEELSKLKEYLPNREITTHMLKDILQVLQKHEVEKSKLDGIMHDISAKLNVPMDIVAKPANKSNIVSAKIASVQSYRQALEIAGNMLQEAGLVEREYIPEMISDVENSKTHMVVMDGIVLAHSRNINHVVAVGGVLLKLQEKVPFVGDGDEMCDFVFAVSTMGVDSHFDMIGEISDVLANEEKLGILRKSNSESEILALFAREV